MKKRFWQLHSWLGLITGCGLLVIGITGSALVFRNELELLCNRDYVRVAVSGKARVPLDTLVELVRRTLPEAEVTGWLMPQDPTLADLAYVTRRGENEPRIAFVNPRTEEIRGGGQRWNATLTGWLLELHYSFFTGHAGILVAGVLAVALCLLGLSGVWLYRDFWSNFFRLRWRAGARIFFSDLHKGIGITTMGFNLLLGFTGAYWNLPHAIQHFMSGEGPEPAVVRSYYNAEISLDKLVGLAAEQITGFRAAYLSLPAQPKMDIVVYGAVSANPLRSEYGSQVAFDPATGEFKSALDIRQAGWWAQTADAFYPLHFGTFGGVPVKILWCVIGLAPGALAVSGFLIWWKRRHFYSQV